MVFLQEFNYWKKHPNGFTKHEKNKQHESAINAHQNIEKPLTAARMSSAAIQSQAVNREALAATFETLLYLAQQDLTLRGHVEYGSNFIQW